MNEIENLVYIASVRQDNSMNLRVLCSIGQKIYSNQTDTFGL